jgi:hypothetical protein
MYHCLWLDEGEFSRIHQEVKGAKVAPPGWVAAMAQAAAQLQDFSSRRLTI